MNMKNTSVILFLLSLSPFLAGQTDNTEYHNRDHHPRNRHPQCDTRVQQLDSLVNYRFNETDSSFTPAYVFIYTSDNVNSIQYVERLDLPLRTPVFYQKFQYDENDNLSYYLYQEWKNGVWEDKTLTEYFYNDADLLIQEVFSKKDLTGSWISYQQHFYEYENNIIVNYLRQAKDKNGNWYDVSRHYYIYDSAGNLTLLYGQYFSTGEIFWKRTTEFDESGKAVERVLQTLKYDPIVKKNVLKNINHQTYIYDIYGDLHELLTDEWINDAWKFTNKHIYYYSLIPNKKVAICHNGNSLCVSVKAVKAHLEHGDKLGQCPLPHDCGCRPGKNDEHLPPDFNIKAYKVYPNPFSSEVNIEFKDADHGFTNISVCSIDGHVLKTSDISNRQSISINLNGLLNGTYLLRFSGKNKTEVETIIKR